MSVFRCGICGVDFDSDFHEMFSIEEIDCCEECFLDNGGAE